MEKRALTDVCVYLEGEPERLPLHLGAGRSKVSTNQSTNTFQPMIESRLFRYMFWVVKKKKE